MAWDLAARNLRLRSFLTKLGHLVRPDPRYSLATRYLEGDGIEIGALHLPLVVPRAARVKYVDRLRTPELRVQYPELDRRQLVEPDIMDDGERLDKVAAGSQDFLIANHFLEHCENPIAAIGTFLRVVKERGIVYLAVPDKRFTFDRGRELTPLEHLLRDYAEGPAWSRDGHLAEWGRLVDEQFRQDPARQAARLKDPGYSIHFHVWTCAELLELLLHLKRGLGFQFEIEHFLVHGNEAIFILRKGTFGAQ